MCGICASSTGLIFQGGGHGYRDLLSSQWGREARGGARHREGGAHGFPRTPPGEHLGGHSSLVQGSPGPSSHQLEILPAAVASPCSLQHHSRLSLLQELLPGRGKANERGTLGWDQQNAGGNKQFLSSGHPLRAGTQWRTWGWTLARHMPPGQLGADGCGAIVGCTVFSCHFQSVFKFS